MVDAEGKFVEGKFLNYMLDADRAGLQLTVHAIGDEANHLLLDYLEELNKQNGKRDRRFRLVHAQVIAPEDFERLGRLGVVAEVQPFHLSDDMRWMEERIGRERCRGAYAFKSIQDERRGAELRHRLARHVGFRVPDQSDARFVRRRNPPDRQG